MRTPLPSPGPDRPARSRGRGIIAGFAVLLAAAAAGAQSLEERLDEEQFIQGLIELELPEVLDHYLATHPAADPAVAVGHQVAAERMKIRAAGVSPQERLAALERILGLRGELIEAHRDDLRRAVWLADQAADLLFELLPIDASGLTTLFGLPSSTQRQRAERVAREVDALAADAEREIERAILGLEATPGYADDIALQMERRRLARSQRDRRIPFLRGVGAFLRAQIVGDDPEAGFRLAAEVLEPLTDAPAVLEGSLAAQARLYRGLALARLGQTEAAARLLEQVAGDPASRPADAFAARLDRILDRAARPDPGAVLAALDALGRVESNVLFVVLIADQRFLLRRRLALAATAARRDRLMIEAYSTYTDLLEADLGLPDEQVRAIVLMKLTSAADADAPLEKLPPLVSVARAKHLAQDERTRAQAIELFRQVLARDDLDEHEAAAVLFGLAKAHYTNEQPLPAARRFTELARRYPTDRQAERAIELGVTIAADLRRRGPDDAAVRRALEEGLDLLLDRYPNLASIDRWRFAAGRLALDEGRFKRAVEVFNQIPPNAGNWLDARYMQVEALRGGARSHEDPGEQRRLSREVLAAVERVRPLIDGDPAKAGDRVRAAVLRQYAARLRVMAAESLIELGDPKAALETLDGLERDPGLPPRVVADVLRARIGAAQAMGRPADARREIERFIATAPGDVPPVLGPILAAAQAEVTRLIEIDRPAEALERAGQELVPLAEILDRWMTAHPPGGPVEGRLRRQIADAYRLGERFAAALALYDRLLAEHRHAVQLLFGRAECLYGLGEARYAEAMVIYKRITAAGREASGERYWPSQLRMLEILDRTGRRTDQIVPRIRRLRQQDPDFGAERLRRRFDALENKYS